MKKYLALVLAILIILTAVSCKVEITTKADSTTSESAETTTKKSSSSKTSSDKDDSDGDSDDDSSESGGSKNNKKDDDEDESGGDSKSDGESGKTSGKAGDDKKDGDKTDGDKKDDDKSDGDKKNDDKKDDDSDNSGRDRTDERKTESSGEQSSGGIKSRLEGSWSLSKGAFTFVDTGAGGFEGNFTIDDEGMLLSSNIFKFENSGKFKSDFNMVDPNVCAGESLNFTQYGSWDFDEDEAVINGGAIIGALEFKPYAEGFDYAFMLSPDDVLTLVVTELYIAESVKTDQGFVTQGGEVPMTYTLTLVPTPGESRPDNDRAPKEDEPKEDDRAPKEDEPKEDDRAPREDEPRDDDRAPREDEPRDDDRPPREDEPKDDEKPNNN